jgi:hypothetical protein
VGDQSQNLVAGEVKRHWPQHPGHDAENAVKGRFTWLF